MNKNANITWSSISWICIVFYVIPELSTVDALGVEHDPRLRRLAVYLGKEVDWYVFGKSYTTFD